METFDLGIAWDQEQDNEFVEGLNNYALKEGLKPYLLHGYNFYASLKDISEGNIYFRFFLNRTSEDDPVFSGLPDFLKRKGITFINNPDNAKKTTDKFQMHSMFISYGLPIPKTVFLKPQEEKQVLESKIQQVSSINLENKPAWFKVLYCFGEIIPCRWHPVIREYEILSLRQIYRLGLHEIWPITKKIKQACKLDFFSTDIAMKDKGKFLVVDYVNDRPNMRKKSKFKDGLPDEIVDKIIGNIIAFVKQKHGKAEK